MDKKEIKAQAEAFCAKPKSYRRSIEGQTELAAHVDKHGSSLRKKVDEILEGRRGFRRVNGSIEFTEDALKEHIARLKDKKQEYMNRIPLIDTRIAELESDLSDRFGNK